MAGTDGAHHASRIEALLEPEEAVVTRLDLNLDSAATSHMVAAGYRFLCNVRDLPSLVTVELADGFKMFAASIGDIKTEDIELEDVLVINGIKLNLVSVLQLARDGIFTTFRKNKADLWKEGEREPVGGAVLNDGLYKLRFLKPRDSAAHTSPAAPREYITSYVANAASSHMEYEDWVTSFEGPAVPDHWVKGPAVPEGWFTVFKNPAFGTNLVTSFENKPLISGYWFAATAEMDESNETGAAAACCNHMNRDGPFVPGKAHMESESDAMHGADFMRVALKEHCLNA